MRFGIGLGLARRRVAAGAAGFDPDAQAFFDRVTTAGGTLSTTEKNATNQLVLDMKSAGIWSSMKAVYPMVGASAAACAQNLKSSSFTGTFTSGWTFASTGVTPNGTSAYFDTNFNPVTQSLPTNSTHFSVYSRTNITSNGIMIGNGVGGGSNQSNFFVLNPPYLRINSTSTPTLLPTMSFAGLILGVRTSSLNTVLYKNTTAYTETNVSSAPSNAKYFLGATNSGGSPSFFDSNQYAFLTIGEGLNSTQASNFYTAVQAFQTTLSRNV